MVEYAPVGVDKGLMLHYTTCPPPAGTKLKGHILLVHGFPQTSYQFRRVITPLADAGYQVIVPDYRGAGSSSKPWQGYTKDVMAKDLHTLVTKVLGINEKIHLVGHDIGSMIVHAYASQYPEDTASVCSGEAPLPGSQAYEWRKHSMGGWHYTFHSVPDLPELLVAGKEHIYLKHFYDRLSQNPNAISPEDVDVYAAAYSQPGALRCEFNCYRAFEEDAAINKQRVEDRGKCPVRCLSLWGAESYIDEAMAMEMAGEFYETAQYQGVKDCGHWIAEENPKGFVDAVLNWVEKE